MATAQAFFPPDISTRIGSQICAHSAPQGVSSPPAVVRCARATQQSCVRVSVREQTWRLTKLSSPSRYTAAVIMNSTYNYDPASRKDGLVDIVANVLRIIVPVLRPDIAVTVGAFPWCELITLPVSCSITRLIRFKCSISRRGFPGCHSRGRWRSHASFRSSISIGRLSTLFRKR